MSNEDGIEFVTFETCWHAANVTIGWRDGGAPRCRAPTGALHLGGPALHAQRGP